MKINVTKFSWGATFRMLQQLLIVGAAVTALSACGPGLASLGPFTIGGSVTGLTGTVVLQNNGKDDLSLTANGSFTFATKSAKDATYAVTVLTQPIGQICTVSSGGGTATDKVTTVSVDCVTQWTGTKQPGGIPAVSYGKSVAVDASGNVYVVGDTTGYLEGQSLVGTSDMFITKYNSSGIKQYTKLLGVSGAATYGEAVAVDAGGNVYVVGYTSGKLGTDPLIGFQDFFLVKYNSKGEQQYIRQLGAVNEITNARSVAVDANLNVYVAGFTTGSLRFSTVPGDTDLLGYPDLFVAKYDSKGDFIKTWQLGATGASTDGSSVAVDASGNVYVAGTTNGGLPKDALSNNVLIGTSDFFVAKYNSAGVLQYCDQRGVTGADTFGRSVAIDLDGNVYVAGNTTGELDFNVKLGQSDSFVSKYNSAGVWQFTNQLGMAGGAATTIGNAIAVDATGSVYLAGETSGKLNLDALTGTNDLFVAKLNGSLATKYLHQLGGAGKPTAGKAVAFDASGNAFVAGSTLGGLDGNVLAAGLSYYFVTKYDANGVKQ